MHQQENDCPRLSRLEISQLPTFLYYIKILLNRIAATIYHINKKKNRDKTLSVDWFFYKKIL